MVAILKEKIISIYLIEAYKKPIRILAGTRVSALFKKQSFLLVLEGLIGFSAPKNLYVDVTRNPKDP